MKKIISLLLVISTLFTMIGCGKEKGSLDVVDFENKTLNIDTSEIEDYIKGKGYEDYEFVFDVDKSIYSCEIYLSEDASSKIEIDGDGYESFVSSARTFLSNGTGIMADALSRYNLTGISSGMVLASSEGVVYCVAVDGAVTYVAHVKSDSLTAEDIKRNVEEIANSVLNDRLTVTMNTGEKFIGIHYEGIYNGGSEQNADSLKEAFDKVKAYLKEIGFGEYTVSIHGYEGMPYINDETDENTSDAPDVSNWAENTTYNFVGVTNGGNTPVFEVVSTAERAEVDAEAAIKVLSKEIQEDSFLFYIVDEEERFLGKGTRNEYIPYVYAEMYDPSTIPPFTMPFYYYLIKYFNEIPYNGYEYQNRLEYGGGRKYIFSIDELNVEDKAAATIAAEKIVTLMNRTLGNDIKVVITLYEGTDNEISVETPAELLEEN